MSRLGATPSSISRPCRGGLLEQPTSKPFTTRFPHFADSFQWHVGDGAVGAGGDVEQVEDVALQVGEFGVEGAQHLTVGGGEFVAGDAGEALEDPCGGRRGAAAVLGVERQLGQSHAWNDRCVPFIWTKTLDDILAVANRKAASETDH